MAKKQNDYVVPEWLFKQAHGPLAKAIMLIVTLGNLDSSRVISYFEHQDQHDLDVYMVLTGVSIYKGGLKPKTFPDFWDWYISLPSLNMRVDSEEDKQVCKEIKEDWKSLFSMERDLKSLSKELGFTIWDPREVSE